MARSLVATLGNHDTSSVIATYLTPINGTPGAGQFRSDIAGRGSVLLTSDLKPRLGIERILMQKIEPVAGEVGSSGQKVHKPINDKFNQIRVVGDNFYTEYGAVGYSIGSGTSTTGYVEVVFVGTGLNMLSPYIDGSNRSVAVSVDGGAETTINRTGSVIISNRLYNPSIITPLVSGLSYGLHTVKIRPNAGADTSFSGFEILNEGSSIRTSDGTAIIKGSKRTLSSLDTQAYNTGFDSGTLGTRGGRVIVYMKKDGTIGKSVQPVAAASLTLSSTDHAAANEEVIRSYYWREFGVSRSDDFSTLIPSTPSNRAFTLEDGTTTLVGSSVYCISATTVDAVAPQSNGAFLTFTFVGTGLDLKITHVGSNGGGDTFTASIDGGSPITLSSTGSEAGVERIQKIVSGLPYGIHTVRVTRTTAPSTYDYAISQFIVYGPKKPTLPEGAIELADYNIMANYSVAAAGLTTKSAGVLSKAGARESLYSGTWSFGGSPDAANFANGWNINTNTATSYTEYTFLGTGIELRTILQAGQTYNWSITVDGFALNAGTNVGSSSQMVAGTTTGLTLSAAGALTGTGGGSTQLGAIIAITGLSYGKHTIRVTHVSGNGNIYVDSWDLITGVHSYAINGPLTLQNALNIGSCALSDNRDFGDQIAVLSPVSRMHPLSQHTTTSSTEVPIPLLTPFYLSEDSLVSISFQAAASNSLGGQNCNFKMRVDGDQIESFNAQLSPAGVNNHLNMERTIYLAKGWHVAHMGWTTAAGTLSLPNLGSGGSEYGNLTVRKLGNS